MIAFVDWVVLLLLYWEFWLSVFSYVKTFTKVNNHIDNGQFVSPSPILNGSFFARRNEEGIREITRLHKIEHSLTPLLIIKSYT